MSLLSCLGSGVVCLAALTAASAENPVSRVSWTVSPFGPECRCESARDVRAEGYDRACYAFLDWTAETGGLHSGKAQLVLSFTPKLVTCQPNPVEHGTPAFIWVDDWIDRANLVIFSTTYSRTVLGLQETSRLQFQKYPARSAPQRVEVIYSFDRYFSTKEKAYLKKQLALPVAKRVPLQKESLFQSHYAWTDWTRSRLLDDDGLPADMHEGGYYRATLSWLASPTGYVLDSISVAR